MVASTPIGNRFGAMLRAIRQIRAYRVHILDYGPNEAVQTRSAQARIEASSSRRRLHVV